MGAACAGSVCDKYKRPMLIDPTFTYHERHAMGEVIVFRWQKRGSFPPLARASTGGGCRPGRLLFKSKSLKNILQFLIKLQFFLMQS